MALKYTEEEKNILNENPDFEDQLGILEEEHQESLKKRRFVKLICGLLIIITTFFYVAYATIYIYRPYGLISNDKCKMVNLKIDHSPIPLLNLT